MKVNVYTKDNDKIVVRVLGCIGSGAQREVFACDYVGEDGREYVIKKVRTHDECGNVEAAEDRGDSITSNRFEFDMGHNPLIKHYLPDFKAISKRGVWLLVERCIPAIEVFDTASSAERAFYNELPEFLDNDMYSENWGYTMKDDEPVVIDLSYDEDDRSNIVNSLEQQAA